VVEAGLALLFGAGWFAVCTLLVSELDPTNRFWLAVLIIVLDAVVVWALAHRLGIGYGLAVGVAGVVALDWYCIPPVHAARWPNAENSVALGAYLIAGALLGQLAATARRRALASEAEARLLADEQAALRRVATLVATEPSPDRVFAAITREVGALLGLELAALLRYESDGTAAVLAASGRGVQGPDLGSRWPLDDDLLPSAVPDGSPPRPAYDLATARTGLAGWMRERGARSVITSPMVVEGRPWGAVVAAAFSDGAIADGIESRLGEFTELAGTAVSNAESRAELAASRARIVTSGDLARQRIERDLHDGVQQRLVSLALDARRAEDLAEGRADVLTELSSLRSGLVGAVDELREVSHGIHPAILTEGGLRPALARLARRSPLPVELEVRGVDRVPQAIEVGVYYVVSEAITNVVKHAHADYVSVTLELGTEDVMLVVNDDGVGGADARAGSGLVGLADRIQALGGVLEVSSPVDRGTRLTVRIPWEAPTSTEA